MTPVSDSLVDSVWGARFCQGGGNKYTLCIMSYIVTEERSLKLYLCMHACMHVHVYT